MEGVEPSAATQTGGGLFSNSSPNQSRSRLLPYCALFLSIAQRSFPVNEFTSFKGTIEPDESG